MKALKLTLKGIGILVVGLIVVLYMNTELGISVDSMAIFIFISALYSSAAFCNAIDNIWGD